ncbi:MscS Mechanosensitive ion channel [Candidatus Koribacter versatilis Ellin345]|uniref:MscS Mechanosensitive ion channel n=1 Tax=Koribacter versatilis (strain Ellin345) TaxID=204669 RepID=Q1IJ76_KORVE|nr:mechanosensitive ion channel family protein [Candidatus Koribacter versatilis]ABF43074.1 MscS Mechanosensitive ion channel [Candidatus Koribacter versatilis Ellin345]
MSHSLKRILLTLIATIAVLISASTAFADTKPSSDPNQPQSTQPEVPEVDQSGPAEVVVEGRGPVLTVYDSVAGMNPQQRAEKIEQRIMTVAKDRNITNTTATIESHPGWTAILIGEHPIMAVTDTDAKGVGKKRDALAAQYGRSISLAIDNFRQDRSWRILFEAIGKALLSTFVMLSVLWLVRKIRTGLRDRISARLEASKQGESRAGWKFIKTYAIPFVLTIGALLRWGLILVFIQAYLTITLGFFSVTREISQHVTGWVGAQLTTLAKSGVDYLPNLLVVGVIFLVTYYVYRFLRVIFGEIAKGELKIRGFYPDWSEPTEKLLRGFVFILAAVVAFPYLPGSKSPAFQGISIFVGVLLSLGSSSAIANAISGVILTYMRSFLVGDWVQIGDVVGEVTEKTILVTRVLTPKAEVITIPNATVMSGSVKNFSAEARHKGVIFHTIVTIGYDAPWRKVHELLIDAALSTPLVLKDPLPFVLQTSLQDFYVGYELNAFTAQPSEMVNIYSNLHQNIQDKFNDAGMEICSPHFAAVRDGNVISIPEKYHSPGYTPPSFRVQTDGQPSSSAAKSSS